MQAGVQLYTLRDSFDQNLDAGLTRLAGLGYRFVELAGLYGLSAHELKAKLDKAGLVAVSTHNGLGDIENGFDSVVSTAQVFGLSTVVVPWVSIGDYAGGWEEFASRLNGVGVTLAEQGLRLAYHNHDFEFAPGEGGMPMEFLADHLDPEACGFEIDIAWVAHAKQDPVAWINKLGDQIDFLHFKDVTADGQLCEVGKGIVDWYAVLTAAADNGIEAGFVEHDNPTDAFESITFSMGTLRGKGVEFS